MAYTYKKRVNTNSKHSISYPNGNPFEKNPSTGGNCTWWAWGRFKEVYKGATGKDLSWTAGAGNACAFYRIMGKAGYKTGKTPKPGAIICWGYNGRAEGNPGHVAFVEQVYKNGDVEISQSGWSSGPLANRRITKKSGYKFGYSNDHFNGFIYNKVEFTNPDGTVVAGGGTTADHPKSWYVKRYGNEARTYFACRDCGWSHKASCAIMGNIKQECGFNPKDVNSTGHTGLCQWGGGRCTNMKSYNSGEKSWQTITHQIKFMTHELETSYKSVGSNLKNDKKSLYFMVDDFCRHYEVCGNYDVEVNQRRYPPAKTYNKRYKNAYGGEGGEYGEEDEGGGSVDMQKRASVLFSSDNFEFIDLQYPQESETSKAQREKVANLLDTVTFAENSRAVPEVALSGFVDDGSDRKEKIPHISTGFDLSNAAIQAPFVELTFGGFTVGSYKNSLDYAPNHITSLNIKKINGEINQYTVALVHQIRAGEDPNMLDRVFSSVRYGKVKIRYGDCESGYLYKDVEAIVTNIVQNRDYVNSKINYTLYATSACNYVTGMKFDFPATVDRPSHVINKLLYNSGQISNILMEVFPGMANQSEVNAKSYIASNDAVLYIDEQTNISLLQYIGFLVSCMSNQANGVNDVIRNSTYYLTYEDDASGAYFKVTERQRVNAKAVNAISVYDVTVGYPEGNDIYSFNVTTDNAWSLLYESGTVSSEFVSDIDNYGNVVRRYSQSYFNTSAPMNEIQKNWWTQVVSYPISAQLVMRGLLKPINLMDYINVNVVFYGSKHITSGLYTIVGQQDTLDGSGFKTSFDLIRVGDN